MYDWQPIETAPTTGKRILMCRAGHDHAPFIGFWSAYYDAEKWMEDSRELDLEAEPPTHWMPLPPVPPKISK